MLSLNPRQLFWGLLAVILAASGVWMALEHLVPPPPKTITIAAGAQGGAFEVFAHRYREILARSHVRVVVRTTDGTGENLRLLADPKSGVDVGFVQGGVTNNSQSPGLESLGRINYLVFFVFYRTAEMLTDLTQLKGRSVAIGPAASGTHVVAERILKASGVTPENTRFLPLAGQQAINAMNDGRADALILGNVLEAPVVQTLLHDRSVRLMSVTRAQALARKFPFLSRLEMPSGVVDFEKNIPANDVTLIGTTNSVLVRKDIHPEIVGLLARALEEVHSAAGTFQKFGEFPTDADPEFPMADGARDFYKNGPSFLERYLPFWIAFYAKRTAAVLVTVIAIVVPVFSYAPKLYLWFLSRHLVKLYRDLRVIQQALQRNAPASKLLEYKHDLEDIGRAASVLPMRHSNLFFQFQEHMDRTRMRLAAAMAENELESSRLARSGPDIRASSIS